LVEKNYGISSPFSARLFDAIDAAVSDERVSPIMSIIEQLRYSGMAVYVPKYLNISLTAFCSKWRTPKGKI